jgi:hypothetical protein
MKRAFACAALAIGLVAAAAAPAVADPPSSAAFTLPVSCNGTTYLVGFTPGHGEFTPALVATNNQVLVPFSIDVTFTDVTTGESEHELSVKGTGSNPNAVTCTINYTATDPESGDVFNIQGSVIGLITPVR